MKFVPLSQVSEGNEDGGVQTGGLKFTPLQPEVAATPTNPPPESGVMGGEDFWAPIAATSTPTKKPESVLQAAPAAPLPTEDKMLQPQFVQGIQSKLDAMPEAQRTAALAKMAQRPDAYGRAAKVIAGRYAALGQVVSPTLQKLDPRLEARKAQLVEQGLRPEIAEGYAQQGALTGEAQPEMAQMTEAPPEYAEAEPYRVKGDLTGIAEAGQTILRGGVKAGLSYEQGVRGMNQFVGDTLGFDMSTNKARLNSINQFTQSMGAQSSKPLNLIEGAITSIGQQVPALIGGVLTGSEPVVLSAMFAQSFGQTYDEGKRKGLDAADNTARAAMYAALEVLGEKFGLGDSIKGLKAAASGLPSDKIASFFAKSLVKQVPGEELTYAGQFAVDKGYGMNPEAGIADFISGAADTLAATVIQGGMLAGTGVVAGKGVSKLQELRDKIQTEQRQGYKRDTSTEGLAEVIAQSKGFLTPEGGKLNFVPLEEVTTEAPTPAPTTEAVKPQVSADRAQRIEELALQIEASGIPAEDAANIAERRVAQAEEELTKQAPKTVAPTNRVEELTQEFIDAGVPPTEAAQRATAVAEQEAKDEAEVESGAGEAVSGEAVTGADRAGAAVAEQPTEIPAAAGVEPVEPGAVVPAGLAPTGVAVGEKPKSGALTTSYADLSVDQLQKVRDNAEEANKQLDVEAVRKYMGDEVADKVAAMSTRARDAWMEKNATTELDAESSAFKGVDEEEIDNHIKARSTLDTSSPEALGKSIGLKLRDVNNPSYPTSPEYGAVKEAIQITRDKGWSEKEVLDAARARAAEWAGADAKELFPELFTEKKGAPSGDETIEAKQAEAQGQKALPAPEPKTAVETAADQAREAIKETKKRGRPALVLTPEQEVAKATERKVSRAAYMKSTRAVDKQTTALERAVAQANQTNRRAAYKELLKLEPTVRGTPVGKKLKETLEKNRVRFTSAEIDNLKREIADEKATTLPIVGGTATVADPKYAKFTNAAQAIAHIIKTGDGFQQDLAKRIRGFANDVKFVVLEKDGPVPEFLKSGKPAENWAKARGMYVPSQKTIYIRGASFGDGQGVNNEVVLHELLHAATFQKLKLGQTALRQGFSPDNAVTRATRDLQRTMESAKERFDELSAAGQLPSYIEALSAQASVFTNLDEFLAYGMSDNAMQTFLLGAKGREGGAHFFSRFVNSVRNFFGMNKDSVNALSDLILVTDKLLSARKSPTMMFLEAADKRTAAREAQALPATQIEEEADDEESAVRNQKQLDKDVATAEQKVAMSKDSEELAKAVSALQLARNPRKIIPQMRVLWKAATYAQRSALVKLPTMEFLVDWANTAVPELRNTYGLMQKMSGMTQQILKSSGVLTTDVHRAFLDDPKLRIKLEKIALVSTIAQVDPSDPTATERSAKLDADYAALGPKGQALYKRIKGHFENLSDLYSKLLDDQIKNSSLTPEQQENLMVKLREMYETGKKITPYFPLVRRGDFWLGIGSGKNRQFYMYESMAERDATMQAIADKTLYRKPGESDVKYEQRKKDNLDELIQDGAYQVGNDINSLRRVSFDSSLLLRGVFDSIDSSNLGEADAKDSLKDAIYQMYLNTMPEQSFRNQFINRKNTTGFSTDLVRNVSSTSVKMATQLARIKYAPLIRNSLASAKASITGQPDNEPFVTEMERRAAKSLGSHIDTTAEQVAGLFNKASFFFYLGGASSALLQPISVFQIGMPVLAGRYGTVNASREMTKMLRVWNEYGVWRNNADGTRSWTAPSIEYSKGLTANERKAVRGMTAYGVAESTFARALYGHKDSPTENLSGPKVQMAKDVVGAAVLGGLMHSAERLSREMMFLTSFRLNQKAGKSFDVSVRSAVDDTNEALGNYGGYNRPLFMQSAVGKVLTQFQMYPLQVTMFLLNNFKQMIAPMDGRTRGEAAVKFFGAMGTTSVLAGAIGLPTFSIIMGLIGAFWRKLDEEDLLPEDMKHLNFQLWFRTVFLPSQLGDVTIGDKKLSAILERGPVNALTGLDIGGRTGLDNLWLRDNKEHKTVREEIMATVLEKAGPGANMVLSMADAYEAFANGDYQKGTEKILPAGFRNFVIAHKYATEGAKDVKGAQVMSKDAFTTGELIGQAIGFRSDLLANAQYVNFTVQGLEQKITNERTKLLNNLDRDFAKGKFTEFTDVLKDISKFNQKFPSYEITEENITSSLEKRVERRASSLKGVVLTEKNVPVIMQSIRASREELGTREQKAKP